MRTHGSNYFINKMGGVDVAIFTESNFKKIKQRHGRGWEEGVVRGYLTYEQIIPAKFSLRTLLHC